MKRFILLVGDCYYPSGWEDYKGSFDTIAQAHVAAYRFTKKRRCWDDEWFEIIDTHTEKIVRRSDDEKIVSVRSCKSLKRWVEKHEPFPQKIENIERKIEDLQ